MSYTRRELVGALVRKKFTTVNAVGQPTSLLGTPAVVVYKNSGVTESGTGVTLTVDFDGIVGRNLLEIDTAVDAVFYSDGANFDAMISVGTVDGTSVIGYPVVEFSLGAEYSTTDNIDDVLAAVAADSLAIANVQSRLPAALVAGRMSSNIQSIKDSELTATPPFDVVP